MLTANAGKAGRRKCSLPSVNDAFTLVELLVVIAIIALLVSILLPALNKAKIQAQKAVCSSNIRQIHFSDSLYTEDNDDFGAWIYALLVDPKSGTAEQDWAEFGHYAALKNYFGERGVSICPTIDFDFSYLPNSNLGGKGINYWGYKGFHWAGSYHDNDAVRRSSVASPSTIVSVMESSYNRLYIEQNDPAWTYWVLVKSYAFDSHHLPVHGRQANYVMGDGHVESLDVYSNQTNHIFFSAWSWQRYNRWESKGLRFSIDLHPGPLPWEEPETIFDGPN